MKRFVFQEGGSQKFWNIEVKGTGFTVVYGRLGTAGQSSVKSFDSEEQCQKEANKLIAEKTKKGYKELDEGAAMPEKIDAPKNINKTFGEVCFKNGFTPKEPLKIKLWGKTNSVKVDVEAYYEKDGITEEQEKAFVTLKSVLAEKQSAIENMLSDYCDGGDDDELSERFTPTQLNIERDGKCALMLDDEEDEENGMAVVLLPEEEVMTQDEYL
jgi:predicted DNA-binding WGR domain protein